MDITGVTAQRKEDQGGRVHRAGTRVMTPVPRQRKGRSGAKWRSDQPLLRQRNIKPAAGFWLYMALYSTCRALR